jgi:hypothetical protein
MSEATISASTKSAAAGNAQQLSDLIVDAEYVCLELARGDAVPVEVLTKAKTLIDPVVQALLPAKAALRERGAPTDEEVRELEKAMVNLSEAIAPVSVQSLHDTAASGETRRGVYMFRWLNSLVGLRENLSLADRFSDGFMAVTVAFLIAALACSVVISEKRKAASPEPNGPAATTAPAKPNNAGKPAGDASSVGGTGTAAPPTAPQNTSKPVDKPVEKAPTP